jgi:hypothetical protein
MRALIVLAALVALAVGPAACTPDAAQQRQIDACRALRIPGRATFEGQPGWLVYQTNGSKSQGVVYFQPDGAAGARYPLQLALWCSQVRQVSP